MKLKDRIQNIKCLLEYCSNEEVHIVEDKTGKFFSKFFSNDDRFITPPYDTTYITIRLATHILNKRNKYRLDISYCYAADRDGEDWATYGFDDQEVIYDYDFLEPRVKLKYSEIPDYIWKIIQDEIYKEAASKVDDDLDKAIKYLDHCTSNVEKFTRELKAKLVEE